MVLNARANVSEWQEFADLVKQARGLLPETQERLMRRIGGDMISFLKAILVEQNILWTGTYLASLGFEVIPSGDKPMLAVGLTPRGPEADRLPVYWKVLERGAQPNVRMPKDVLAVWAAQKLGNINLGLAFVNANRAMTRGVQPNPVLSRLFHLSGQLVPIGLTPPGEQIVYRAMEEFIRDLDKSLKKRSQR
jgi:hypothetical protein